MTSIKRAVTLFCSISVDVKCVLCIRQYRNNTRFSFSLIIIKMQPRDVASCGDTAVAGLISEQSECYASPPTAVIPVLNHDSRGQECPSIGLLSAGDYACIVLAGFGTSDGSKTR